MDSAQDRWIEEACESPRSNVHETQLLAAERELYFRCLDRPDIFDFIFFNPSPFNSEVVCSHVELKADCVVDPRDRCIFFWLHDQRNQRKIRGWVRRNPDCASRHFWRSFRDLIQDVNSQIDCQCGQNERNYQVVLGLPRFDLYHEPMTEVDELSPEPVELEPVPPVQETSEADIAFDQLITALKRSRLLAGLALLPTGTSYGDPHGLLWCEIPGASHNFVYGRFVGNGTVHRLVLLLKENPKYEDVRRTLAPVLGLPLAPFRYRASYSTNLEEMPTERELTAAIGQVVTIAALPPLPPQSDLSDLTRDSLPEAEVEVESEALIESPLIPDESLAVEIPEPEVPNDDLILSVTDEQTAVNQAAVVAAEEAQRKAEKKTAEVRREVERFVRRQLGLIDDDSLPPTISAQLKLIGDAHDALTQQLQQAQANLGGMISPTDHTKLKDELTALQAAHAGCEERIRALEESMAQRPPISEPGQPTDRSFKELVAELDEVPLLVLSGDFLDQLAKANQGGRGLGFVRQLVRGLTAADPPRRLGWLLRRLSGLKKKEQARMDDIVHAELAAYLAMAEGKQRVWTDDLLDQLYELGVINEQGLFDPSGVSELLVARWQQRAQDLREAKVE